MEGKRQRVNRVDQARKKRSTRPISRTTIQGGVSGCQDNPPSSRAEVISGGKAYVFINGILNNPENVEGWTDNAEAWVEAHHLSSQCTRMEYRAGVLTRMFYQNKRVDNLEKIVLRMMGESLSMPHLVLVGHSNGCDIIQRFINRGKFYVAEAHLIAAASERDFNLNGFNNALRYGLVGKIYCYSSPIDEWLKKAQLSSRSWVLRKTGIAYGYLGLNGPINVAIDVADRVIITERNYLHSEWVGSYFHSTMGLVTGVTR